MKPLFIQLLAVSSLLVACGGGSSNGDDDPTPDGPSGIDPDAPSGACTAATSYVASAATTLGAVFGCETTGCAIADADFIGVDTTLNTDATPDLLSVELYPGFGVFPGKVMAGVFELTGDELDYATCGACVLIYTDADGAGGVVDAYMATGGTLTITSLTPFAGTISNATFTHVTLDEDTNTSTPVGDCDSAAIGDAQFSATATEIE